MVKGEPRSWCEPFLKEVTLYAGPGTTRHDDFVDSFSQAVRYFADRWLTAGVTTPVKDGELELSVDLGEDQDLYDAMKLGLDEARNPYDT
jgi:hypothetical protein